MKFSHFFIFMMLGAAVLFERLCRTLFDASSYQVLKWCVAHGSDRVVIVFLAGVGSLSFVAFLSYRFYNMYVATTAKAESYVFLGDKIKEGFYAYKEGDELKTRVFIPSFLDKNEYPASSMGSLYYQKIVFKGKDGHFTKFDFFYTANLVLYSFIQLALFMFSYLGILVLLKTYALYNDFFLYADLRTEGIGAIFKVVNNQTNNAPLKLIYALVAFYLFSVIYIKMVTRKIERKKEILQKLPPQIKDGYTLQGVIIAADSYSLNYGKQDSSQSKNRYYKQYAVEFDKEFNPPVVLNFSLPKEKNKTLIDRFDEALKTGAILSFVLNEDLVIDKEKF